MAESRKEEKRLYYLQNKEKILKKQKEYQNLHKNEINQKRHNRYIKNQEKELLQSRKRYKDNIQRERTKRYNYFIAHKLEKYLMVKTWNQKRSIEIFNQLGNKCSRCGYDNIVALEIHHRYGSKKTTRTYRDYLKSGYDLTKIELICANCHKIEHYKQNRIVNRRY